MFKDCRMTSETIATAEGAGYRLSVEASPMLCIDPAQMQDMFPFAATLVVTNTTSQSVEIEHWSGEIAGFSFRADSIADARDPRVPLAYDPGPVDPDDVQNTTATIPAGGEYRFRGDPRYVIQLTDMATGGTMIDGSPALPEERFDRSFRLTFYVFFSLTRDGVKTEVSETMPAMLRVMVRDVAHE
jgi:hypothetical protein